MLEAIQAAASNQNEVEEPSNRVTLTKADLENLPAEAQVATAFNLMMNGAFTEIEVDVQLKIEDYTQGDVLTGAVLALTHFYQTISGKECDVIDFMSVLNEVTSRYLIAKALESKENVELGVN